MDAGSWMEAFERASERLVADWQVKLVTTGLLAEGVFPCGADQFICAGGIY